MTAPAFKKPWWDKYSRVLEPAYEAMITAEQTATELQYFNLTGIPGLLQTEEYSRAVTSGAQLLPMASDQLEQLIKIRLDRQWRILEQTNPPRIEVLFDESTLHRQFGGAEVLREQLMHLVKLTLLPCITIRVLPLSRPLDYIGDYGLLCFTLLKFYDEIPRHALFRVQSGFQQSFTENAPEVWSYDILFRHLWQDSLGTKQSLNLINNLIDQLAREP